VEDGPAGAWVRGDPRPDAAEGLRSVYLEVPVDRDAELEPPERSGIEVIGAEVHG
jgi:hypothetical protein